MRQAIQLPIPFDFEQQAEGVQPSAVPGAAGVHFLSFDAAELRALTTVRKAAMTAKTLIPSLVLPAQAALFVSFSFALMFIAAVIGG